MVLTNSLKNENQVNNILMCLLERPLTYIEIPNKNSNWTRKKNRNDNYLIQLEKIKYITKETDELKDARKKMYTIIEERYLKDIIRDILTRINKQIKDEGNKNKELINSKELQNFIKNYVIRYKEIILLRERKEFPTFNQMVDNIMLCCAYIDKKLYDKYLKEKKDHVSIFINLCRFYTDKSQMETATYTVIDTYGSKKDFKDYNNRRILDRILNY